MGGRKLNGSRLPSEISSPSIVRSPAPVKSRRDDRLYSKQLPNCDAFIVLSCRDFTGAEDRTIDDRHVKSGSLDNFCLQVVENDIPKRFHDLS